MHELRGEDEPKLDDILARLAPCDLVLVEGYKREGHPKIETRRLDAKDTAPLSAGDPGDPRGCGRSRGRRRDNAGLFDRRRRVDSRLHRSARPACPAACDAAAEPLCRLGLFCG